MTSLSDTSILLGAKAGFEPVPEPRNSNTKFDLLETNHVAVFLHSVSRWIHGFQGSIPGASRVSSFSCREGFDESPEASLPGLCYRSHG